MIQSLIPAAPPTPEVPMAPQAPSAPGKSFSAVLKSSVQRTDKTDDGTRAASDADNSAKNIASKAGASSASPVKTNGNASDSGSAKDPADSGRNKETQNTQEPNEILRQLVLQMSALAQQAISQASFKNIPSAAQQGALSADAAGAVQEALMPLISGQSGDAAQSAGGQINSDQTATQGGNFLAALAGTQVNAGDKADSKFADRISISPKDAVMAALKGNPQESLNAVPPAGGAENGAMQAFDQNGKAPALLSKTPDSNIDVFSQFKMEISPDAGAGRASGGMNDSKDSSGIYAQGVQGQNISSAHEQSPIQETVPAGKLTSLDAVISKAVDSGQKNLVIRIDPPDLGSLHIRLSLDNGVLKADVRVDSSSVKDSFNLALPQIKTSLENSGIKVSEFHVDVREDQYRNGQERNNQGQQQRQGRESKQGFSDFFA